MRTKQFLAFGVLAAVVGATVLVVTRQAPARTLALARVTTATVRAEVTGAGSVQPARVVALSFTGQGRIGKVHVAAGDLVTAGQVLATLDATAARLDIEAKEAALRFARRKLDAVSVTGRLDRLSTDAQTQQATTQTMTNRLLVTQAKKVRDAAIEAAASRLGAAGTQAGSDAAVRELDRARAAAADKKLEALVTTRDDARTTLETAKAATASAIARRDEARLAVDVWRAPVAKLTIARDDARRVLERATADLERARVMNPDAAANGSYFSDSLVVDAREKLTGVERDLTSQELVVTDLARVYEYALNAFGQTETAQSNAQARVDLADANLSSYAPTRDALARSLELSSETSRRSLENIEVMRRSNAVESARDAQSVKQSEAVAGQSEAAESLALRQATLRERGTRPVEVLDVGAMFDAALQALGQARERLQQLEIRAPFDGIVSTVAVKAGELAGVATPLPGVASSGSISTPPAFTVLDSSALSARVGFPDVDLTRIVVGQSAVVRFDALVGAKVVGKVASIEPSPTIVNSVSTTYVRVSFEELPRGLRVGMAAAATVVVGETVGAVVVPASALTEDAGVLKVRRATPKEATAAGDPPTTANTDVSAVVVATGERSDGNVQIVSGLSNGDMVVLPDGEVVR